MRVHIQRFLEHLLATLALLYAVGAQANLITITGDWDASNTAAASRPFLFGGSATCATPLPYPGTNASGPFAYDVFNFFNAGPATCVTVSYVFDNPNPNLAVFAYGGGFDPISPSSDYLSTSALGGAFPPFSFNVAANSAFQLVAYSAFRQPPGTYSFSVDGETISRVPEPGTLTLLGLGLAGLAASRRRKQ